MPAGRPKCHDAWTRAVVVVGAALVFAGCYRPSITDGGFMCAPTSAVCPDGFKCGADNRCSINPVTIVPPQDSGMEMMMMMTDAGGDSMCSLAPLCLDQPAAGDMCSPSCQTGCDCGRCNVVNGKPACVASGKVKLGEVCTPGSTDNCAPGLFCRKEICGNGLARCYRHCTTNDECDGSACTIPIDDGSGAATPYTTCDVPASTCDPVANSGCPDPALNCYLTSANQRLCDCPGSATPGKNNAACTIYSDCDAGYVCISGVDGQTTPHCHFACNVAAPSCAVGTHCIPSSTGATYGYCGT
jgi:hypothetical protein